MGKRTLTGYLDFFVAERYNPWFKNKPGTKSPIKFSTYATRNIRGFMLLNGHVFETFSVGQRGFHTYLTYRKMKRLEERRLPQGKSLMHEQAIIATIIKLDKEYKKDRSNPTNEEIEKFREDLKRTPEARRKFRNKKNRITNLIDTIEKCLSFDQPDFEAELGTSANQSLEDPSQDLDKITNREELKRTISNIIHGRVFTVRESHILEMRFGLIDGKRHSLEKIGKIFKVTPESIRQAEGRALIKLRHPSISRQLR